VQYENIAAAREGHTQLH